MPPERKISYRLCRFCGQPMKPKNVKKRPNEYDHAQGCPYSRQNAARPLTGIMETFK